MVLSFLSCFIRSFERLPSSYTWHDFQYLSICWLLWAGRALANRDAQDFVDPCTSLTGPVLGPENWELKLCEMHPTHVWILLSTTVSSHRLPCLAEATVGDAQIEDLGSEPFSFFLLVVRMLVVAMPGALSGVLVPSSKARSP